MIPSILLALTVIIAMIDVLVGIHRGFGFGIVRLLIWVAGTVVCMLLARPVTVWLLLKFADVPDLRTFVSNTFDFLGNNKETLGTHFTGTILSFLVPVVFVVLFILSKFITWIIYCIVKQIIKKAAKRAEAHNAAVDAVKSIERMELPTADGANASPIPQPNFREDNEKPDDFGTFGIYPKENSDEIKNAEEMTDESTDDFKNIGNNSIMETDNVYEDIDTVVSSDNSNQETTIEDASSAKAFEDGFEAIAAASEDGFESLAQSAGLEVKEEPKKAKTKKEKSDKPLKLKKKHSLSLWITQKTAAFSVLGGVLGLLVSLMACAIIMEPAVKIFTAITTKEDAEAVVDLAFTLSELDTDGFIDNAFEKGNQPVNVVQKEIALTSDICIRSQDFVETVTDGEKSIVYKVYKYSGANAVASFIYDKLIEVNIREVGLDNKGVQIYNFQDTLKCYLDFVPRVNNLITIINKGQGVSQDLISGIKECLDFIIKEKGKGEILIQADKLALVNSLIDTFNQRLELSPIIAQSKDGFKPLEHFNNYDDMKTGIDSLFDIVKRFISAGILE